METSIGSPQVFVLSNERGFDFSFRALEGVVEADESIDLELPPAPEPDSLVSSDRSADWEWVLLGGEPSPLGELSAFAAFVEAGPSFLPSFFLILSSCFVASP
ncbi:hypothetical protein, partial [Saccharopolyspora tripterygii]